MPTTAPEQLHWTPELVERFWNGWAQTRLSEHRFSQQAGRSVIVALDHLLPRGGRILDFGAGDGDLIALMCERGLRVAAHEPSERRARTLAQRLDGLQGFLGVVGAESTEQFDFVTMVEVIEHLLDEEIDGCLTRLAALTRPGGTLAITTPNNEDLDVGTAYCPVSNTLFHRVQHVRSFSARSLSELLSRYGFEEVVVHQVEFSDVLYVPYDVHWGTAEGISHPPPHIVELRANRSVRNGGEQNLLYVGRRRGAEVTFGNQAATRQSRLVTASGLEPVGEHCYACILPDDVPIGDTPEHPLRSAIEVFEDGRPLGPAHTPHQEIRAEGGGRVSHWHNTLYLSASDNSDPRTNNRTYTIYAPGRPLSERQQRVQHLAGVLRDEMGEAEAYRVGEVLFYEACPSGYIGEWGKLCWRDDAFVADYQRLSPGNRRSFERKYVVSQLVMGLYNVAGDMAECGVYNGATAYFMARARARVSTPSALHLFDSFEGLSRPGPADGDFWTAGGLAMPEHVARGTLDGFDNVHFHRGWIPVRFEDVADLRFAFVHIDVDLYQPTLDSMTFFYPRLVRGGVVVCDDYGFTTCPGATRAVNEFMADKPEHVVHLPTGQGVIFRGE